MLNITDTKIENTLIPVFRLAFRPFFLFGCLFSLFAMALWFASLSGYFVFTPYGGLAFWHSHEMLYGFTCAIVVGFLLTAVQNWTGINGVRGTPLVILFCLWLLSRIFLLFPLDIPNTIILMVDCLFLPLAAYFLSRPLIAVRQTRNLFFVPILLMLTAGNITSHLGLIKNSPDLIQLGNHIAIWLIVMLMTIIGGRVIPFFTANGTGTIKASPLPWLEYLTIGFTAFIFLLEIIKASTVIPDVVMAVLLCCAGLLHLYRWLRWRFTITLKVPLLWSLHIGYLFIPAGLLLMGMSYVSDAISYSHALHALTAGAMANMILAMISRVSLGHTGRPLHPNSLMILGFTALIVAGLSRALGPIIFPSQTLTFYQLSMIGWIIGFGLFIACYTHILVSARADGRPG